MSASPDTLEVFLGDLPERHTTLFAEIDRWVEQGWLRVLDRSFAAFLARRCPDADPLLILSAAFASHQLGRGHACLDLKAALADAGRALSVPPEGAPVVPALSAPTPPAALLAGVDLANWKRRLSHPELVGHGQGASPLVLDGTRLYLRRYWRYEQAVRRAIAERVSEPTLSAQADSQALLAAALDTLFPPRSVASIDWQKVACALAARQAFSVITGGPGTGKTTTVVRLLALLQSFALASGNARGLRIRLAAPTGKAAARLNESIAAAVESLPVDGLPGGAAVRAAVPKDVTTVHRLLGSRPDTRRFRHDAQNRLPLDVLVIDEASMLDLEMTAAVFEALPAEARLILLGDKDQLSSVEAGAVLGDLCLRADDGHYTGDTAAWLHAVTGQVLPAELSDAHGRPLDQAIAKLRISHRFSAESGIGRLAEAVNAGDANGALLAFDGRHADLAHHPLDDAQALRRLVLDGGAAEFGAAGQGSLDLGEATAPALGYRHYLTTMHAQRPAIEASQETLDDWARQVLAAYGSFQLLCALRAGPHGVEGLNHAIAGILRDEGLIEAEQGGWYLGRPVLVTRNDYGLGLMNGDVGVTLALPGRSLDADGQAKWILRVAFPSSGGKKGIRWVLPSRLRAVETVFAMTVHKSQGSEFSHAALLLPQNPSLVLTRELVYTGITRARHWFTLVSAPDLLRTAISRRVERMGGLAEAAGRAPESDELPRPDARAKVKAQS